MMDVSLNPFIMLLCFVIYTEHINFPIISYILDVIYYELKLLLLLFFSLIENFYYDY